MNEWRGGREGGTSLVGRQKNRKYRGDRLLLPAGVVLDTRVCVVMRQLGGRGGAVDRKKRKKDGKRERAMGRGGEARGWGKRE